MKLVPYYVLALAMAIPAVLVGVEIPWWLSVPTPGIAYQSDLRVLYTPAYMLRVREGTELYNFAYIQRVQAKQIANDNAAVPFLHPALEALLFIPFTYLRYHTAYLSWVIINCASLGAAYLLLRKHLGSLLSIGPCWIAPALLLGFMPTAFSIFAGQDSLLLLLIIVGVFRKITTDELGAGVLLGLGVFRFQVLLPIVLLFLLWRHFRLVYAWILSGAAVFGLSMAITGVAAQRQYLTLLREMGRFSDWLLVRRMPNLRALFSSFGVSTLVLVVVSTVFLFVAFFSGRKCNAEQKFLLGISVSCIVTYYFFLHDLSILILPLLIAMDDAARRMQWLHLGGLAAVLSAYSALWFFPNHFYLAVIPTTVFFCLQCAQAQDRITTTTSARHVGVGA